jgi:LCP family protein required for cell wall assembly
MARKNDTRIAPRVAHGRRRVNAGGVRFGITVIATALAVALVSGTSVAAVAVWDVASSAKKSIKLANQPDIIPQIGEIEGGVNLLLVGSDSREGQDPNVFDVFDGAVLNDVNMILHIAADHKSATVVSIPRDLVVPIADCPDGGGGWQGPINASLSDGGLACVVLTVEQLTGLSIPYAAVVQFGGVIGLADAVGGVDVCVTESINDDYTQTYLEAGNHTLSGMAALQFLRTRHGVGDGSDLSRISNQQVFLSALVRKLKSEGTLTNPVTLYNLAKAAVSNLTPSDSLNNLDTMVSIAMALRGIPLDRVVFVQYPASTGGEGIYLGKVQPKQAAADELFAALLADQPIALSGETGAGSIKSGQIATDPVPTAAPRVTGTGTATPTPAPVVTLPEPVVLSGQVLGQNAGEVTCSKGNN